MASSVELKMLGLLVFSLTLLGSYSDPLFSRKLRRENLNQVYSTFNHQPKPISPSTLALSGDAYSEDAFTGMTVLLDESDASVIISLSGISGNWFGVGFDAPNYLMADNPYAIIIDGAGKVSERKLDTPDVGHGPGTLLESSIEVLSAVEIQGNMLVTMKRALVGKSPDHYTFDATKPSIPLLMASGPYAELGYHLDRKSGETLNLAIHHQEKSAEVSTTVGGTVSSEAASTSMTLLLEDSMATVTMSGPSGMWFGVGFDAPNFLMADFPYAIIVDGSGEVSERKLNTPDVGHGPGTLLEPSVEVLSTVEEDGFKTVVIRRALVGASSDHYTFDASKTSLPLLIASGTAAEFGYHGVEQKSGETLSLGKI